MSERLQLTLTDVEAAALIDTIRWAKENPPYPAATTREEWDRRGSLSRARDRVLVKLRKLTYSPKGR